MYDHEVVGRVIVYDAILLPLANRYVQLLNSTCN